MRNEELGLTRRHGRGKRGNIKLWPGREVVKQFLSGVEAGNFVGD